VELDFMDPRKYPDASDTTDIKYVVIPSAPSEISEFRASATTLLANATTLLAKMQQIDFQGLSTELKKLVVETRMRLDGVDFKGLAVQWKKTGESIDALARSPDTIHSLENLNKTLEVLRTTMAHLDTQVDSNGTELKATLVQAEGDAGPGEGGPRVLQHGRPVRPRIHQRPAELRHRRQPGAPARG